MSTSDDACGCGTPTGRTEELDIRHIPPVIRPQSLVLGIGAMPAGGAIILVAPHRPGHVLDDLAANNPDLCMEVLTDVPGEFRMLISR